MAVNFKLSPDDSELSEILDKVVSLDTIRSRIQRQRNTALWLRECHRLHDRFCNCGAWRGHIKTPHAYVLEPPPNTKEVGTQTERRILRVKREAHPLLRTDVSPPKRRVDANRLLKRQRKQFLSNYGPLWCQEDPFFDESSDSDDPWQDFDAPEDVMEDLSEDDGDGQEDSDGPADTAGEGTAAGGRGLIDALRMSS